MRFYVTYTLILFSLVIKSQTWLNVTTDYINNPSFEEYTACPQNTSDFPSNMWIDSCKYWTAPTMGTSDYFNSCQTNTIVSIPLNYPLTYQPSFHGNAYCGFLAYSAWSASTWSEYIQTKLKKKLIENEIYYFTMRINRANYYNFSVQNIGAHFSKDSLSNKTYHLPINIKPTVLNNTGFLNDTINWTLISGSFLAKGGEEYLTIGWFGDSIKNEDFGNPLETDCYFLIPPDTDAISHELLFVPEIYYAVDSLTLSIQTKKNISNFNVNIFTPNNDGVNDYLDFSSYNLSIMNFNVYNRWGNLIFTSNDVNLKWIGINNSNLPLTDGVYYYIINAEIPDIKDKIQKKGYLSIIH